MLERWLGGSDSTQSYPSGLRSFRRFPSDQSDRYRCKATDLLFVVLTQESR